MPLALPAQEHEVLTRTSFDSFARSIPGKVILTITASLAVAAAAHLSVHVPFTPVPFTLADFAVLMVGMLLGPRLAFAALALYLAEGAAGLPVFAPGGLGGVAQLLGPTGGYLLAYPFAAGLASLLSRSLGRFAPFAANLLATTAASVLIMVAGASWLGIEAHLAGRTLLTLAVVPFLPGQVIKVVAAAGIATTLRRWRSS